MIDILEGDSFDEASFLQLLNRHVSPQLPNNILKCSGLSIDNSLKVDDLLEPLHTGKFPRSNLGNYNWFLGELVTAWPKIAGQESQYDTIYICSFYLLSQLLRDAGPIDLIPLATALIVQACGNNPSLRAQCVRFIQWLMTIARDVDRRESSPHMFLLVSIIAIVGTWLRDLVSTAENLFEHEKLADPAMNNALDRSVSDVSRRLWIELAWGTCGPSGDLEQTSRRLGNLLGTNPLS